MYLTLRDRDADKIIEYLKKKIKLLLRQKLTEK